MSGKSSVSHRIRTSNLAAGADLRYLAWLASGGSSFSCEGLRVLVSEHPSGFAESLFKRFPEASFFKISPKNDPWRKAGEKGFDAALFPDFLSSGKDPGQCINNLLRSLEPAGAAFVTVRARMGGRDAERVGRILDLLGANDEAGQRFWRRQMARTLPEDNPLKGFLESAHEISHSGPDRAFDVADLLRLVGECGGRILHFLYETASRCPDPLPQGDLLPIRLCALSREREYEVFERINPMRSYHEFYLVRQDRPALPDPDPDRGQFVLNPNYTIEEREKDFVVFCDNREILSISNSCSEFLKLFAEHPEPIPLPRSIREKENTRKSLERLIDLHILLPISKETND